MDRVRRLASKLSWRTAISGTVAIIVLAAVIWMFAAQGPAAGLVFAVAVAAVGIVVRNPWEQTPRPTLTLEVGGVEVDKVLLGRRRALDVEELVADARRGTDLIAAGARIAVVTGKYLPPTADDYSEFEVRANAYEQQLRAWVESVEAFLKARSRVLVARVSQQNPTQVDALKARVELSFPPQFRSVSALPMPQPEPDLPEFPRRPSALSLTADNATMAERSRSLSSRMRHRGGEFSVRPPRWPAC
jgi:hypothetical protein